MLRRKIKQTPKEKISQLNEYEKLGETRLKLLKMRAVDFTKRIEGSSKLREKISRIKNIKDIKKAINEKIK